MGCAAARLPGCGSNGGPGDLPVLRAIVDIRGEAQNAIVAEMIWERTGIGVNDVERSLTALAYSREEYFRFNQVGAAVCYPMQPVRHTAP